MDPMPTRSAYFDETPTTSPAEVLANLERRAFYHGTSKRAARRILREGLKDYSWTEETPMLKSKARPKRSTPSLP
ncbi:MAG: hypothetical protein RLZZ522_754 [Verrucomicrobiota bacterium]